MSIQGQALPGCGHSSGGDFRLHASDSKKPARSGIFVELLEFDGGAKGDRTPDLGIANAALSQLSYRPGRELF
jgi:hypothetical protein